MKFIKYQLQVSKVKYAGISETDIANIEHIAMYYGINGYAASNDENECLVILGEIHEDTMKECRIMLKGLKQKLKEIFHVKQITPLIEMSGSIMI